MRKIIVSFSFLVLLLGFIFTFYLYSEGKLKNFIPGQERCGIQNCHGVDISCGAKIPQVCTAIYQAGDRCRQFANCVNIDGGCVLQKSTQFEKCKSCVLDCISKNKDSENILNCESKCGEY